MPIAVGANVALSGGSRDSPTGGAILSNGNYVVVTGSVSGEGDNSRGIYAQLVGSNDVPIGSAIHVNTTTTGEQGLPSVAAISGGFVVVWVDDSQATTATIGRQVRAQRFDLNGNAAGSEFLVPTTNLYAQTEPQVIGLTGGGFVVVWLDSGPATAGTGAQLVRGQIYTAGGVAVGSEFNIDSTPELAQYAPAITALSNGGFAVAYTEFASTGPDAFTMGIRTHIFSSTGSAVGGEIIVNTNATAQQDEPSITQLANGNIVVVWRDGPSALGPFTIRAQILTSGGTKVGSEVTLATVNALVATPEVVSIDSTGGFFVVWEVNSTSGLFGQEFSSTGASVGSAAQINTASGVILHSALVETSSGFLALWSAGAAPNDLIRMQRYGVAGGPTEGDDTIIITEFFQVDDINGLGGNDYIDASGEADILRGGAGNDTLIGGAGFDDLYGGTGDDLYDVDGQFDDVFENANEGTDTVQTTANITLWANVENLILKEAGGHITGTGNGLDNTITGNIYNNTLNGLDGADRLIGGGGTDTLNGGSNIDTAVFSGLRSAFTITQGANGTYTVAGTGVSATLNNVEYAQFNDQTVRLHVGTGVSLDLATADPDTFMSSIRDFDGNNLGSATEWLRIGQVDLQGDGDVEHIFVNRAIGRWASIGPASDNLVYFGDHGWGGDTRVVGIYIDPLVQSGEVVQGSDHDSQRRFQNDLQIENINGILGANDYDHDGLQEVYFRLTDGTAYLHAYMHADGNIRYANYQSQQQVIDFMAANGWSSSTYAGWFG